MTDATISLVLPLDGEDPALRELLVGYAELLTELGEPWEILLVPYGRERDRVGYEALCELDPSRLKACAPATGWGSAVRAGLAAADGQTLCYTSWRRTSPTALAEMLRLALRNPELVLRANRRTRDTRLHRLGSLLFNVECRLLLQVPAWDVNGTPKIFPRAFHGLLSLRSEGDLLDAELAACCERFGYPVMEVPIDAQLQSERPARLGTLAALHMYLGVFALRSRVGPQTRTP